MSPVPYLPSWNSAHVKHSCISSAPDADDARNSTRVSFRIAVDLYDCAYCNIARLGL